MNHVYFKKYTNLEQNTWFHSSSALYCNPDINSPVATFFFLGVHLFIYLRAASVSDQIDGAAVGGRECEIGVIKVRVRD